MTMSHDRVSKPHSVSRDWRDSYCSCEMGRLLQMKRIVEKMEKIERVAKEEGRGVVL